MVAGLSPGYGIIADAADVILYSAEGEFGEAIWSAGAALPFVGQYIAAQRMLFKAKKSGEKIHKLYRGVDQWYPGRMVQDGMHVSEGTRVGPHFSDPSRKLTVKDLMYTTADPQKAANYGRFADKWGNTDGVLLEFHVPESYLRKIDGFDMHGNRLFTDDTHFASYDQVAVFSKGIPKDFLTKVYKHGYKLPLEGDLLYKHELPTSGKGYLDY